MLSRYKIYRGKRPPSDPLPRGIRQDTRFRTHHPLRPTRELSQAYLASPNEDGWKRFADQYNALIGQRFKQDRRPFDELAALATDDDVYMGCNCPTKKNPTPQHCHTFLALRFMKRKYPKLRVLVPKD